MGMSAPTELDYRCILQKKELILTALTKQYGRKLFFSFNSTYALHACQYATK